MAFIGVSEECKQYIHALRIFRRSDMLIVPGTGLLTDAYFLSSWGPYSLFKWSLMAKLRHSRVLFVSVGAGPIYTRLGQFLVKSTLALADYRSYRDDSSLTCVKAIGFARPHDKVYPDLAFSLPETLIPSPGRSESRRIVGLGLMSSQVVTVSPIRARRSIRTTWTPWPRSWSRYSNGITPLGFSSATKIQKSLMNSKIRSKRASAITTQPA